MNRAVGTLVVLKRGSKAKLRSIPCTSVRSYLDLHVATLEMARLERQLKGVNEKKKGLEKEIEALQSEIEKMIKARQDGKSQEARQRPARVDAGIKRPLKTMILDY